MSRKRPTSIQTKRVYVTLELLVPNNVTTRMVKAFMYDLECIGHWYNPLTDPLFHGVYVDVVKASLKGGN